jgi:hypothetical protein
VVPGTGTIQGLRLKSHQGELRRGYALALGDPLHQVDQDMVGLAVLRVEAGDGIEAGPRPVGVEGRNSNGGAAVSKPRMGSAKRMPHVVQPSVVESWRSRSDPEPRRGVKRGTKAVAGRSH